MSSISSCAGRYILTNAGDQEMHNMEINTYLNFNGDCRAAFEFYRSVFGGEFAWLATFGDGPPDMAIPEDERDRVMHVSLSIGSGVLMGSDTTSAFGPPSNSGNNFSISVATDSREETDRLLNGMSEGGTVTMPPADMFWGAYFAACTDKFGINWMFNHDLPGDQ